MKNPSKRQSDVDTNGRVRRVRVPQTGPAALIKGRFLDGPYAGRELDVPRGAEKLKVGLWTYTYAGKDGRIPLYCKLPASHAIRRVLMNIIGKHGMDPRVEQAKRKRSPIVGKNTKRGQGARRRADVATA